MESQVFEEGELKRLSKNIFQREDYTFDCWNTKPDGTGTDYFDMQEISNLAAAGETVNLYAIWDRYQYFHDGPLVFGSSMDGSGNPWRYFNGTLANIKVIVY